MPDLAPDAATLPTIDGFPASDSRVLAFTVLLADGTPRDISDDTVEWYLLDKPYTDIQSPLVSDSDPGVEVVTDSRVDTTAGEFEVRIDEGTLAGEWGSVYQRVRVDAIGETRQSWTGEVVLTDSGGSN
jgi:hypothetical protein